jgi:hypothetical protein
MALLEIEAQLPDDLAVHELVGLRPEYLGHIIYHRFNRACPLREPVDQRYAGAEYDWGDVTPLATARRMVFEADLGAQRLHARIL